MQAALDLACWMKVANPHRVCWHVPDEPWLASDSLGLQGKRMSLTLRAAATD
jgi:hypothetical protein